MSTKFKYKYWKFSNNKHIREGSYGKIYYGVIYTSSKNFECVIKLIDINFIKENCGTNCDVIKNELLMEARNMVKCANKNVVKVYDYYCINKVLPKNFYDCSKEHSNKHNISSIFFWCCNNSVVATNEEYKLGVIIMEKCDDDNLFDLLLNKDNPISIPRRLDYIEQIASGLSHIHKSGFVHRDVKPENMFLKNGIIKIGDFGVSKLVGDKRESLRSSKEFSSKRKKKNRDKKSLSIVGSASFLAPEVVSQIISTKFNIKQQCEYVNWKQCDVYSFGILSWMILTRKTPHDIKTYIGEDCIRVNILFNELYLKNIRPNLKYLPKSTPIKIIDLIKNCWNKQPNRRPQSWSKILEIIKESKNLYD